MAVLAKKSETRCKLCQHPKRTEIDYEVVLPAM